MIDKNFLAPLVRQAQPFVTHLEQIIEGVTDTTLCVHEVHDLIKQWCCKPLWLDPGWFSNITTRHDLILTGDDSAITAVLTVWPAKWKGVLHDHKSWSAIGCLCGKLRHSQWLSSAGKNLSADTLSLHREDAKFMSVRDVTVSPSGAIYRVDNCEEQDVALSLHVYGDKLRDKKRYIYKAVDGVDYSKLPDQTSCNFELHPHTNDSLVDLTTEKVT